MKRSLILATAAATMLAAAPAMAQTYVHTPRTLVARARTNIVPRINSVYPKRGGPGTVVTIKGTHFAKGTKILIANKLVNPYYVSSTTMRLRIPTNTPDGTIKIKVPRINKWYSAGKFNYIAPRPAPRPRPVYKPTSNETLYKRRFMASTKVKAEIRYHNQQIANLDQIRTLAHRYGFKYLVQSSNTLIVQENARHKRAMTRLDRAFRVAWNKRHRPARKTWTWTASLNISL